MPGDFGTSKTHNKIATQRKTWEIAALEKSQKWVTVSLTSFLDISTYLLVSANPL